MCLVRKPCPKLGVKWGEGNMGPPSAVLLYEHGKNLPYKYWVCTHRLVLFSAYLQQVTTNTETHIKC